MFYLKQYYSFTNQIQNKEKIKKERVGEREREKVFQELLFKGKNKLRFSLL